jgi:ornithine cyclodeaminase/alanine dehydrogenase-like protein (mu-crystallin family)
MHYVDEEMVAGVLKIEELIAVMRQTMIDFSQGRIVQPPRRMLAVNPYDGFFGSMPAAGTGALGAKLVTFYPGNAARGLPTHSAVIVLFRPETGEPIVMMDGGLITEMRTAAVTAAYVDAVAAPDVKTLAVLGAGVQGRSHIQALTKVREFEQIRIWNRTPERAARLAAETGGLAVSREQAVREADVVVVATAAADPVLEGKWLRPGAKVASVGWRGPDGAEVDADTMSHVVIVDSRQGALADSGNIRRFNARIYAELGEVLDGSRPVDRRATIVFDSIGMACQDIAAAKLVYAKIQMSHGGCASRGHQAGAGFEPGPGEML